MLLCRLAGHDVRTAMYMQVHPRAAFKPGSWHKKSFPVVDLNLKEAFTFKTRRMSTSILKNNIAHNFCPKIARIFSLTKVVVVHAFDIPAIEVMASKSFQLFLQRFTLCSPDKRVVIAERERFAFLHADSNCALDD